MKTIQIDREVLCSIYGECHSGLNEVFSEFLGSYDELKQNLFSAFESGNLSSLKRLLHFHGPSFMYLGIPSVAGMFKELEHKCSQADNYFLVADDFKNLMQLVEESWQQVVYEMEYFKRAV